MNLQKQNKTKTRKRGILKITEGKGQTIYKRMTNRFLIRYTKCQKTTE